MMDNRGWLLLDIQDRRNTGKPHFCLCCCPGPSIQDVVRSEWKCRALTVPPS